MLHSLTRQYLLTSLTGLPDILEGFLGTISGDDPLWDFQPDLERFSLREIVAHLEEFDPVWLERAKRIRDEETPYFPSRNPAQAALDNDYSHSDPISNLSRLRGHRAAYVELLKSLSEEEWKRAGRSEMMGPLTMEDYATFVLAHDGYHTTQVAQWLALAKR